MKLEWLPGVAMWVAIGVGFVVGGRSCVAEQERLGREKAVSACQKIHDPQAQADCIKGSR